ncbi:hypothetical protein AUEXF2481DRAFT_703118 [Aureobasidium subglaciale EXF-2481]|uniref:Zn(2)-C6 fungal-type domain-containing protein n=1 Tax=Aureobasidium subglaciale (strain EXF-2481) TaxID=1043005 RepID=A0A074Y4P6_AURSE|nr:uncharacterized protein AUEXF2481DRAFT_703118 [Aureobasidium subglaciale EXF-2481]KEQ90934.1 hypothetical protein AUEXF2481DRAFT_703118 [Aureobasidium subglaciale EXF-2481]
MTENPDRSHQRSDPPPAPSAAARIQLHRTACFNCRSSRQKCDRQSPCMRCASQQRRCDYPQASNRGRKQGTALSYMTSKPDTVEKLLQRINESPVGDQVIAAIISSSQNLPPSGFPTGPYSGRNSSEQTPELGASPYTGSEHQRTYQNPPKPDSQSSLVSPLHILADAVETERLASLQIQDSSPASNHPDEPLLNNSNDTWLSRRATERLIKYFKPSASFQKDWQVLASQSVNAPVRLSSLTCDPIASRLIDDTDAERYFELFFTIRNPLVCLLDPILHTSENVRPLSFTLFSVVCALGCAMSDTTRDRSLYPTLLALAESNIKWSIATSVKSVETIQAIFTMEYWSPVYETQKDDPYWLHLSHAILIARELGLNKNKAVTDLVASYTSSSASQNFKERFLRNIERTWLAAFFAEKSFGIVTGRVMNVGRSEIDPNISEWWKKPMACPFDRVISGVVEMRILLMQYLEERERMAKTREAVEDWQARGFDALQALRMERCLSNDLQDGSPSAAYLPILAYYMDHSILVLNANALRDLYALNALESLANPCKISRQTVDVASRSLNLALFDPVLVKYMYGTHNNQFIMICHAVSEILFATTRGCLPPDIIETAAATVRAIARHMEAIARSLPDSSAASLYTTLANIFSQQLDKYIHTIQASSEVLQEPIPTDWWNALGGDMLVDMSDLFPEQLFPELAGQGGVNGMFG